METAAIHRRSFVRRLKVAIGIASAILVALFAMYLCLVYFIAPWSLVYEFQGRFEQLPPNDEALVAAIKDESRVMEGHVEVERQDDGTVNVRFGVGGPLIPRPMPDLDHICARLGYSNPIEPFREIPHRDFRDVIDQP